MPPPWPPHEWAGGILSPPGDQGFRAKGPEIVFLGSTPALPKIPENNFALGGPAPRPGIGVGPPFRGPGGMARPELPWPPLRVLLLSKRIPAPPPAGLQAPPPAPGIAGILNQGLKSWTQSPSPAPPPPPRSPAPPTTLFARGPL